MTMVTVPSEIIYPGLCSEWNGNLSLATGVSQTASGHYEGRVFNATQDITISHVGVRVQAVSGSPTMDVRVETVTAGFPTNTLWSTTTNLLSGTLSTGWLLSALTLPATITKGQVFAVVCRYASGTSYSIAKISNDVSNHGSGSYGVSNIGSDLKTTAIDTHAMSLGTSSTTFIYHRGIWPVNSISTAQTFNNTSTAAKGISFQVPFKCRCKGIVVQIGAATGDLEVSIRDHSDNVQSSSATNYSGTDSRNAAGGVNRYYFSSPVVLSANTTYVASVAPTSATNTSMSWLTPFSSAYLGGFPGGANYILSARSGSTWTDDASSSVAILDLILDQVDDGTGTGSSAISYKNLMVGNLG